ncbi:MAG TPA: hypothetical protein VIS71_11825 [Terrimicrobium sp.]
MHFARGTAGESVRGQADPPGVDFTGTLRSLAKTGLRAGRFEFSRAPCAEERIASFETDGLLFAETLAVPIDGEHDDTQNGETDQDDRECLVRKGITQV